jgi:hypothetical protein
MAIDGDYFLLRAEEEEQRAAEAADPFAQDAHLRLAEQYRQSAANREPRTGSAPAIHQADGPPVLVERRLPAGASTHPDPPALVLTRAPSTLGRMLGRAFMLSANLPADIAARLSRLPGEARSVDHAVRANH